MTGLAWLLWGAAWVLATGIIASIVGRYLATRTLPPPSGDTRDWQASFERDERRGRQS
jgi:hypothetical protein